MGHSTSRLYVTRHQNPIGRARDRNRSKRQAVEQIILLIEPTIEPSTPSPMRHGQGRSRSERGGQAWANTIDRSIEPHLCQCHSGAMEAAGELIDNKIDKQGESRTKPAAAVDGERRDDSVGFIHERRMVIMECHREKASGCWMLRINNRSIQLDIFIVVRPVKSVIFGLIVVCWVMSRWLLFLPPHPRCNLRSA